MNDAVFYELTPLDMLVLLAVWTAWSSAIWIVVEGTKKRAGWVRPYSRAEYLVLSWGPPILSAGLALIAWPVTLHGVGQPTQPGHSLTALSIGVGLVGAYTSKLAHDYGRRVLDAVFGRAVGVISGRDNNDNHGSS